MSEQRRKLRFDNFDAMLADVQGLIASERAEKLRQLGNWTLGQTLNHLSTWMDFGFDGYPASVHAPLPARMILRVFKKRILTSGMMAGVKIRGIPGGTLGTEIVPTDPAYEKFTRSVARFQKSSPTIANPAFGVLKPEEWIQLNLRHAELHLSFLLPG